MHRIYASLCCGKCSNDMEEKCDCVGVVQSFCIEAAITAALLQKEEIVLLLSQAVQLMTDLII